MAPNKGVWERRASRSVPDSKRGVPWAIDYSDLLLKQVHAGVSRQSEGAPLVSM